MNMDTLPDNVNTISMSTLSIIAAAILLINVVFILIMLKKHFHIAPSGTALIRTGMGGIQVSFSKMISFPIIHQLESIDITAKNIVLNRTGQAALICKDHLRLNVRAIFTVQVNQTSHDILKVAQSLGSRRVSSESELAQFFEAKFGEALKTVAYKYDLREIMKKQTNFKDEILMHIGVDLNGFVLDDLVLEEMSQTPVTDLNPQNIFDAEGIRKITDHLDAMTARNILDITYPIAEDLTVWPNDAAVSLMHTREVSDNTMVTRLSMSSHAGTHIDAPSHFLEDGKHVDEVDLRTLIGPCVVMETDAAAINEKVLAGLNIPEGTTRLLLKTRNSTRFSGTEPFFSDSVGLTTDGAKWLLNHQIDLVGIDYMSIATEADGPAVHKTLLEEEVVLLETLDLRKVVPGPYRLVALPLRLKETDGSPVRAVLLSMD